MATWINEDGLRIEYGADEAVKARVTEYTTLGPKRLVEIIIDADFLPATGTVTLPSYVFPQNAVLSNLSVTPEAEDFAGGTDVDVNLVDASDGSSNSVAVSTLTLAELNAGQTELLDVALTDKKVVSLTTDGTFTAGKATILIEYIVPKVETDTLVWDKSA